MDMHGADIRRQRGGWAFQERITNGLWDTEHHPAQAGERSIRNREGIWQTSSPSPSWGEDPGPGMPLPRSQQNGMMMFMALQRPKMSDGFLPGFWSPEKRCAQSKHGAVKCQLAPCAPAGCPQPTPSESPLSQEPPRALALSRRFPASRLPFRIQFRDGFPGALFCSHPAPPD